MTVSAIQIKEHFAISLTTDALERLIESAVKRVEQALGPDENQIEISLNENDNYIYLPRAAEKITSVSEGLPPTAVDLTEITKLDNNFTVYRTVPFKAPVTIIYSPVSDSNIRDQAVRDLVELRLLDRGLLSEQDGSYKIQQMDIAKEEEKIIERLRCQQGIFA